jgi:hypothetical protein
VSGAASAPRRAAWPALTGAACLALLFTGALTLFGLDPARGSGYAVDAGALCGAAWVVWHRRSPT